MHPSSDATDMNVIDVVKHRMHVPTRLPGSPLRDFIADCPLSRIREPNLRRKTPRVFNSY
ncbi:hypothetical protein RHOER0001_6175 [Rhodococcus erythropolis SK121]|nr:hypothetical protein RHOER0001_6175 [Rhodococcus erythropolis SK121]